MTDKNRQNVQYEIGPIGAIATVPAAFLSSALFEVVQGAYHLGEGLGRAAGRLRRR